MPRIQRSHNAAVIEVSIPLNLSRGRGGGDDDDEACFICAHPFCAQDTCGRSVTHLSCCTQTLCCTCAVRVAKRCKCADECEAVIAFCPFCREIAALGALEIFLGTRPTCKGCSKPETTTTPAPSEDEMPPTREAQETP